MADKSNSSKSKLKRSGITDCGGIRPLEPLTLKDLNASYYYFLLLRTRQEDQTAKGQKRRHHPRITSQFSTVSGIPLTVFLCQKEGA